jgi:hypothetical protein
MSGAWFCMVCDETGQSEKFDLEARKHTDATGHGTVTSSRAPVPLALCIEEVRKRLEKREG